MKSIKPIALNNAKILSNEEMKNLRGGSGSDSNLIAKCNADAPCNVTSGGVSYAGTCIATVSSTNVTCHCKAEVGGVTLTGADSACLSVTP